MQPDTNSPTPIDPRLTEDISRLTAQPVTVLPTRTQHDDGEAEDDTEERQAGSEKRQKLNLWKCKQCREARKKCFPADRAWPQKCDRCLAHKPDPLPCSEPELNTRKRGPNLKEKTRDKEKEKSKDKSPKPPKRTPTASTSEPRSRGSSDDEDGGALSDEPDAAYERPKRIEVSVSKGVKREYPGDSVSDTPKVTINDENYRPAVCYQDLGDGEFRIMKLAPGTKDDKNISCSFVTASVKQRMEYEAISYLWGEANQESMKIHLTDPHGKSHPIFIRRNLYEALKFLRHPQKIRYFWVDALCINHGSSDKAEKNKQTAMKRCVFRNAENLCFWLGEDDNSKTGIKFIPQILNLSGIDKLVRNESLAIDNWIAFVAMLKNPVFSRLWLVQEVAVARNVTLHSGPASIHYQDFVDAVAIFKSFRKELCLLFRSQGKNCKDLSSRKIRMAVRFIEVSTNALRITTTQDVGPKESKTQRLLSLEELVSYLSQLASTVPLDRIYSVLAIAKDGPILDEKTLMPLPKSKQDPDALEFDYDAKVVDVYQNFVFRAIKRSNSLDIICRNWAGLIEGLPTWVRPMLALQPAFDSNSSDRTEADSLVGLPDHNNYHASRGTVTKAELFDPKLPTGNKYLKVYGFIIDTISKLTPRAPEGIILSEWLTIGGCEKEKDKWNVPESFWRTLVADRDPNGSMPPSWYPIAFQYCLRHLTAGDINTNRLIHESEADATLVVNFLQRMQGIIWNRKFLVTEKNWVGLAPTAADEKDILVILHGCSVPVLLRPFVEGGEFVRWLLVGECYVHGMMDGEAMELEAAGKGKDFIIR